MSFKSFATKQYDCVIVGAGPGGYVAAIRAGQKGLKTACIEKRNSLGGTCLNVGCIPSKALLNISHKYHEAKHSFDSMGIKTGGVELDFGAMQTHKDKVVTGLTKGIEGLFKKNKVDYIKGYGEFSGKNSLKVKLNDGGEDIIEAKNIIIATGSVPAEVPGGILPIDENRIISSTGALALKEVPKKLLVIGGGVIGMEMGSVYSRLGSEVEVIEFAPSIFPSFDKEISNEFQKIVKKEGIKVHCNHKVVGGSTTANGVKLEVEDVKSGKQKTFEGDYVLVCTGRKPFTDGLNLSAAGLDTDKMGRIEVDDNLETRTKGVYAIGDVTPGPMLAHKGEKEGIAAVENISGEDGHVNHFTVPNVVYTHPEIAYVGYNEEELKAKGVQFNKGKFLFAANSRAKANLDYPGFVKVLADKETDKLLGVHIVGPQAGELIAEAVLALEYGASAEDIGRTCHSHPTLSEAIKEACLATYDKPIHM